MTTDDFCFYLQNRLIQTSQTGGQQYSDTFPFSIPWLMPRRNKLDCLPLASNSSQFYSFRVQPEKIKVPHSKGMQAPFTLLKFLIGTNKRSSLFRGVPIAKEETHFLEKLGETSRI
jgi:hypothetical protein